MSMLAAFLVRALAVLAVLAAPLVLAWDAVWDLVIAIGRSYFLNVEEVVMLAGETGFLCYRSRCSGYRDNFFVG